MKTLNKELGLLRVAKSTPYFTFDASDISSKIDRVQTYSGNTIFDDLIKKVYETDFSDIKNEASKYAFKLPEYSVEKNTSTDDVNYVITKLQEEKNRIEGLMLDKYQGKDGMVDIFNNLAIGKDKARERAKNYIKTGTIEGNYSKKNKDTLADRRRGLINNIRTFLGIQLLIQDLGKLLVRRAETQKAINEAISKQDLDTLKKLKPLTTEQENQVSEAIKSITAEQERQKALAEAQKKIDEAKTEEEKKKAQKDYDNLVNQGSKAVGTLSSATGIPKGALYIGIGIAVVITGVLIYRGIRK
jgi:hypothetical protein